MTIAPDSPLATLWCPSPNVEPRRNGRAADMLLLHYTGMDSSDAALDWLTREELKVSCHYLIDEEGRIAQMVSESMRAWHAGQSLWAGETDLNSCSIGIEIHNPGHEFGYRDFPDAQMQAVEALKSRRFGPPPHPVRTRAGPFGHRSGTEARSGREVRLGALGEIRYRSLGAAHAGERRARVGAWR